MAHDSFLMAHVMFPSGFIFTGCSIDDCHMDESKSDRRIFDLGSHLSRFLEVTLAECKQLCLEDQRCRSIDFSTLENNCHLNSVDSSDEAFREQNGWQVSDKVCSGENQVSFNLKSTSTSEKDFHANEITTHMSQTEGTTTIRSTSASMDTTFTSESGEPSQPTVITYEAYTPAGVTTDENPERTATSHELAVTSHKLAATSQEIAATPESAAPLESARSQTFEASEASTLAAQTFESPPRQNLISLTNPAEKQDVSTDRDQSPLALATAKVIDEFQLEWEIWAPWTVCHRSKESHRYEKLRFKLCLVSNEMDNKTDCHHHLTGIADGRQTYLKYAVQREECIADVDGSWAEWTAWSTCSASCDEGTTSRRRKCAGKSVNGRSCIGQVTQNGFCVQEKCPQDEALLSRSRSVLKRREELLPTHVFTESDSAASNIGIATVAIIVLVLPILVILSLDFFTLKHQLKE
ncbi:hypothetical protein CAPTEDRAFT_204107 [Capitella teleta]|uniref:Apple domain-containing protein n=1 Tax=Capitella teleta TaxID=283909 RepID=R7UVT0_CAPTE|nr:hypothetical protein CAPTEDRAFT_204107 [Capitella teleta]|eukprot:ELU07496.1 hypothetical protein CAPTEDRAFT_204107 [Capitella teleta]